MEKNIFNNYKGLEKVFVVVVDDDEFEYVKFFSYEIIFNEVSKVILYKVFEVKEKIVLFRFLKDYIVYFNFFMFYIDNRSKKIKEEKEKVVKIL